MVNEKRIFSLKGLCLICKSSKFMVAKRPIESLKASNPSNSVGGFFLKTAQYPIVSMHHFHHNYREQFPMEIYEN